MKKIIPITLLGVLLGGCAMDNMNFIPSVVDPSIPEARLLSKTINVGVGESLHNVIRNLDDANGNILILDKTFSDITFDRDIQNMEVKEFLNYVRLVTGKSISFRKYGRSIYSFEEAKTRVYKSLENKTINYSKIPKIPINIQGKFTYYQVFNMLRGNNINIYANINNKDNTFNYDNEIENFEGNLKDLLVYICSRDKLFIEKTKQGFELRDVTTKYYDLKLPQINITNSATTGAGGVTLLADKMGIIEDLDNDFKNLLSSTSKYSLNKSDGTLIVTGGYEDLAIVDKKMQSFMERFGKSINIEMSIYEVTVDKNRGFGVDYSSLINEITGISSLSKSIDITNASSLFAKAETPNTIKIISSEGESKINSLVFNFLNKYGRTKVLTKPTLETINNLPVHLALTDETDYIKEINENVFNPTTTNIGYNNNNNQGNPNDPNNNGNYNNGNYNNGYVTNTSTTSTNITPETFIGGFELKLHPRIVGDKIKIAIENVISKLNKLETLDLSTKDANGNTINKRLIQLKNVSKRKFSQIVSVKDGEMAIIGGYIDSQDDSTKNGLPGTSGSDGFWDFATSAKSRAKSRKEIVITIKARIID
jgi:hypothetical protein